MHASTHEVAWVATVLEDLPDIDVLTVRVESDSIKINGHGLWLGVLNLAIHARGWSDAVVLAKSLRLNEVECHKTESTCGVSVWRKWGGWVADASQEFAVWVEVTAAELETDIPTLFEVS